MKVKCNVCFLIDDKACKSCNAGGMNFICLLCLSEEPGFLFVQQGVVAKMCDATKMLWNMKAGNQKILNAVETNICKW